MAPAGPAGRRRWLWQLLIVMGLCVLAMAAMNAVPAAVPTPLYPPSAVVAPEANVLPPPVQTKRTVHHKPAAPLLPPLTTHALEIENGDGGGGRSSKDHGGNQHHQPQQEQIDRTDALTTATAVAGDRSSSSSSSPASRAQTGAAASPTTSAATTTLHAYTAYAHSILWEELGPAMALALYDPWFLGSATAAAARAAEAEEHHQSSSKDTNATTSSSSSESATDKDTRTGITLSYANLFPQERHMPWSMPLRRAPPVMPRVFHSHGVGGKLLFLKQVISMGLGRTVRDGRLAEQFAREGAAAATATPSRSTAATSTRRPPLPMERPLRSMVRAYASYAVTFLQLVLDGEGQMPDLTAWHTQRSATVANITSSSSSSGASLATINHHVDDPLLIFLQALRPSPEVPAGCGEEKEEENQKKKEGVHNSNGAEDVSIADSVAEALCALQKGVEGLVGSVASPRRMVYASQGRRRFDTASELWGARMDVLERLTTTNLVTAKTASALQKVLDHRHRASSPSSSSSSSSSSAAALDHHINSGQYAVTYTANTGYGAGRNNEIRNGRFWNSIRPVVGCSGLTKLCEEADGCRYFCNLNYLMGAVPTLPPAAAPSTSKLKDDQASPASEEGKTAVVPARYGHQIVAFGSNNEYDWDLGVAGAFARAGRARAVVQARTRAVSGNGIVDSEAAGKTALPLDSTPTPSRPLRMPNTIGRFTVFDCTLSKWTPPAALTDGAVGFGHATFCLDQSDISPSDPSKGLPAVSFRSLKPFLLSNGQSAIKGEATTASAPVIQRYTLPQGILMDLPATSSRKKVSATAAPYVDPTTFDEVSLLKLDVEGFEHRAFPAMVAAELQDLAASTAAVRPKTADQSLSSSSSSSSSKIPLIFFDRDAPRTLTTSHLGMEFHRAGHKHAHGSSYTGALRAHYSLMHLYASGFVMFAQEKNPQDYCCYEIAMTHYRHFVRSEAWLSHGPLKN